MSARDLEGQEADRERRDLGIAELERYLKEEVPRWSATRRALEARLRWLKTTETLTAPDLAAEAYRMLDKATRWKEHDQLAR